MVNTKWIYAEARQKVKDVATMAKIAYVQGPFARFALLGGTARVEKVPIAKSARPTNRIPVVATAKTVSYAVQPPLPHAVRGQRA